MKKYSFDILRNRLNLTVSVIGILTLISGCNNALVNEIVAMRIAAVTPVYITLDSPNNVAVFENGSTAPVCFTSLKLTWDSVSTATSYNIFRELSASGNFTTKLNEYTPSNNAGTLEWIDTTAVPGKEYFYKIQAASPTGRSKLNSVLAVSKPVPGTPVSSISLTNGVIIKGNTSTVTTFFSPVGASVKATTWTSSMPGIATVDAAGMVTALSKGTTIIKATSSDNTGVTGSLTLTVVPDKIITIAGTGSTIPDIASGAGTALNLYNPTTVVLDSFGNIYFSDNMHYRIRKIDRSSGLTITVAGNGAAADSYYKIADNVSATSQYLPAGMGIVLDSDDNLFLALSSLYCVTKISAGLSMRVAGYGTGGAIVDGTVATAADVPSFTQITVDSARNLYIGDGNVIYKVTAATGRIAHFAGIVSSSIATDGGLAATEPFYVGQMAISANGDIYFPDYNHHIILKIVPSTGIIYIVAGTGSFGFSGDGGQAKLAKLNYPSGVALDSAGNLYISDTNNHRIRVVSPTGIITTIAGTGTSDFAGDGLAAISAQVKYPMGLAVDSSGTIYFADSGNNRIRKLF